MNRIYLVNVIETRLIAVERYVVAENEDEARRLAEENDWSSYDGLADGGEADADASVLKREADDCEEVSIADMRTTFEEGLADPTAGIDAFMACVGYTDEEKQMDKHLYGI